LGVNTGKEKNSILVYFPDLDEDTGINPTLIDELLDPTVLSNYEIQIVSPLGFFTEVYSFLNTGFAVPDSKKTGVDLITYCRILDENKDINPTDDATNTGYSGYVGYGNWRAGSTKNASLFATDGGNVKIGIDSVSLVTTPSGNGKYLKITLDTDLYEFEFTAGGQESELSGVRNWHEPIYVVNLIDKNAGIADTITTQYKYGGDFTKIQSLIGLGSGLPLSLQLVSERWEDCVQSISGEVNNDYATLERFITVKDFNGNERLWLNVTEKTKSTTWRKRRKHNQGNTNKRQVPINKKERTTATRSTQHIPIRSSPSLSPTPIPPPARALQARA
jgi:hypothetical protein